MMQYNFVAIPVNLSGVRKENVLYFTTNYKTKQQAINTLKEKTKEFLETIMENYKDTLCYYKQFDLLLFRTNTTTKKSKAVETFIFEKGQKEK